MYFESRHNEIVIARQTESIKPRSNLVIANGWFTEAYVIIESFSLSSLIRFLHGTAVTGRKRSRRSGGRGQH